MFRSYFIVKLTSEDGANWINESVMIPEKVGLHLMKIFGKDVVKLKIENLKPSDFEEE